MKALRRLVLASFQDRGAAFARICDQGIVAMTGIGLDELQHRQQVHPITGLVAHPDDHDALVVTIIGFLSVLALDPAISAFEDMAVGIGVAASPRSGKSAEPADWGPPAASAGSVRH
jgi:hypothetical protein